MRTTPPPEARATVVVIGLGREDTAWLQDALALAGVPRQRVLDAAGPDAAVEALRAAAPDLVLADLRLGAPSLTLLAWAHERLPGAKRALFADVLPDAASAVAAVNEARCEAFILRSDPPATTAARIQALLRERRAAALRDEGYAAALRRSTAPTGAKSALRAH